MTVSAYERGFIQHLVVPESLSQIVRQEFPPDVIPTESLRAVYSFAIDYWHSEARDGVAPSAEAMREHFGVILAEHEIDLDIEPQDVLDYCMNGLRGSFIDRKWQRWVKDFASDMSSADILAKPELLSEAVTELMSVQMLVSPSSEHVDLRMGMQQSIQLYNERRALRLDHRIAGGITGLRVVDEWMAGIRPGELVVLASPPKTGKSYLIVVSALACWLAGVVPVIYTLENSVELTMDRIACYAAGVSARSWQRGECTDDEVARVHAWRDHLFNSDHPFHILQPEPGKRTMGHMARRARTLGEMMFIDQLTFVEPRAQDDRLPRYQQIGHSLHELKALISTGTRMPTMLAHQINRDGVKAAEKLGYLEMYHMAEAAEVERTADWVLAMWQTRSMRDLGQCYLQLLASRREDLMDWMMNWRPWNGIADAMYLPGPDEISRDGRAVVLHEINMRTVHG